MSIRPIQLSVSKAAAAVINAFVSIIGLAVSIAPLSLGADEVSKRSDQPPFAALVVGVVLGVLGLVGSIGIWRGERWGMLLTIGVRTLDGLGSLAGVFESNLTLRTLAIASVLAALLVVYLLLRRDQRGAEA